MSPMNRIAIFVAAVALASPAFGQMQSEVPLGANYDPEKHVNPVITYVEAKDFKPSTYNDARMAAGIALMGLSKETGSLEKVDLADLAGKTPKDLPVRIEANFYPVVRQTFKLKEGGDFILHSFKPPRIQRPNQPMSESGMGFPFPRRRDPKDKRFGPASLPEELEVRGRPGLIFDQDGTLTVAWQEEGVYYTATAKLSRKDLFRVLDDLL
jgi:hypothetical protein